MIRMLQTIRCSRRLLAASAAAIAATSLFALERGFPDAPEPRLLRLKDSPVASVSAFGVAGGVTGPGSVPHGKRLLAPTAQAFESYVAPVVRSPDLDGSGSVDALDRDLLLADWGTARSDADLDGEGVVDGRDLGLLLGACSTR